MAAPMGQPMAAPMGGQIGLPSQAGMTAGPVGMGYYSNTMPPNPYGMQVDSNGLRYAILPEIDPRIILANRQKKVPPGEHPSPTRVFSVLTIDLALMTGNQAKD